MVSMSIGVFKVDFTTWSKLTAVENHLIRMAIIGLVINLIGSTQNRPIKVILTLIGGFKVFFFYRLVDFDRGRKSFGLNGPSRFSGKSYRIRPYPTDKDGFNSFSMFFTYVQFFQVGFTGW